MSVNRTDYLMYGVKLAYDAIEVHDDKYLPMVEGHQDAPYNIIADGMGGDYLVAGKIIAESDPYDGMVFTEITEDLLPKDTEGLAKKIADDMGFPEPPKLRLYLFSHYS